jgi:ABC-2 type transport system permease protein
MKGFLTLFAFNYKKMMKMRIMWFVAAVLLVIVGGGLYYIGTLTSDEARTVDVYVENGTFIDSATWNDVVKELSSSNTVYEFKPMSDDDDAYPQVVVNEQGNQYDIEFIYKNNGDENREMESLLVTSLTALTSPEALSNNLTTTRSYENDNAGQIQALSLIVFVLTYFLILLCGATITQSVSSEKINKIIDILSYKVSPATVVFSQIFAILTIACQMLMMIVIELVICVYLKVISADFINQILESLNIGYGECALIVLFVFLGCLIYTVLYAICGILVTSQEQQQVAPLPVTIILLVSFGIVSFLLQDMNPTYLRYTTFVPFIAPMTLPGLLLSGTYQYTDLIIPLLIFILFVGGVAWVTNKIILPRKIN